jgi:predicted lipase
VTGFVAVDSDRKLVVVSFRGSVSVRNWLNDFDFPQVSSDICIGCFVHQGWWSAWYEARASVLSSITGICDNYPGYQLVVTGHSAGGAIGTLAAAELRKMGYTAVLVCLKPLEMDQFAHDRSTPLVHPALAARR